MNLSSDIEEYCNNFDVNSIEKLESFNGWITIQTPFVDVYNDSIELFIQIQNDMIIISDGGITLNNLYLLGYRGNSEILKVEKKLLDSNISHINGILIIETNKESVNIKMKALIFTILELYNILIK